MQIITALGIATAFTMVSANRRPRGYYYGAQPVVPVQPIIQEEQPMEQETVTCTVEKTQIQVLTQTILQQCETQTISVPVAMPPMTETVVMTMTETGVMSMVMTETATVAVTETSTIQLPPIVVTETQPVTLTETLTVTESAAVAPAAQERNLPPPQPPVICATAPVCPQPAITNTNNNVQVCKNTVVVAVVGEQQQQPQPVARLLPIMRKRPQTSVKRPCKFFLLQGDHLRGMSSEEVQSVSGLERAVERVQEGDEGQDQVGQNQGQDQENPANSINIPLFTDVPILTIATL